MKASELRISNLVFHEDKGIIRITANDIVELSMSKFGLLQPIELSEEILLKCGFNKDNYDCLYLILNDKNNNVLWVKKQQNNFGIALNMFHLEKETVYLNDLNFLHQLQNLIHALTNEELTVNL